MSLSSCPATVDVIANLTDAPVPDGTKTVEQFKDAFDQAGREIKAYINNTLIPQIEAQFQTKLSPTNQVGTTVIADGAVTTDKIYGESVTTGKLDDEAVTTAKIDDEAVTTAKLDDDAVTTAKLDDGAVTAAKLGSDITYSTIGLTAEQVVKIYMGTGTPTTETLPEGAIYIQYTEPTPPEE